jgi:hypothetical protein
LVTTSTGKRIVIHDRRFMWWDGQRLTPVRLSEKARAHLSQVKALISMAPEQFAALVDRSNEEVAQRLDVDRETVRLWRKDTGLHRPRGPRLLPVPGQYDENLTLGELQRACGWGSASRFSQALRRHRPEIHARAVANGRARSSGFLKQMRGKK